MSPAAAPQMTALLARVRAAGTLDIATETLAQARAAAEGLRRWQAPPGWIRCATTAWITPRRCARPASIPAASCCPA
ncbi:hypothetical protein MY55_04550 [Chromobacterium subtsugae]|nr:hypothetical protein MY55_04550 [Chromobacterium subtsugae]